MVDKLVSLHSGEKHRLIDMGDQTHAEQVVAHPPFDLLTDGGDGPNRRLRVDVGQTGFFAGREFRTFKELNIAIGGTYVIRAVVPIDVILFSINLSLDSGHARMSTLVGGTAGGTFSETLPIFGRNNMSERPTPFYTPVAVLTAGGTHTGGTTLDILRVKVSNDTAKGTSVGGGLSDERGIAANTYYFKIENLDLGNAVAGVLSAWWEERV